MDLQGSYVQMPGTGQAGIHGADTVLGQLLEGYTLYIYSLAHTYAYIYVSPS